jgi:hypothetical protein
MEEWSPMYFASKKGHTEGLEPSVLEHLVSLIVGVKDSKIEKKFRMVRRRRQ